MRTHSKHILVFDPQASGVSGDMMVGALLDLGADPTRVVEAMKSPCHFLEGCHNLEVTVEDTIQRGIGAKRVVVKVTEDHASSSATNLVTALSSCLAGIDISDEAGRFAVDSLNTLVGAESAIHAQKPQHLQLHETASADTLADIIGTATALDDLGFFRETIIYSTPVALGGGTFQFSHGISSSPAPATLEILRSRAFPCVGGPVEAELATPTGVSLLTCLVNEPVIFYPPMRPTRVGYGAGARDYPEMPNVLRVTLGEPIDTGLMRDEVYVIETNLDDVTGELIGFTMERLLREGARDVVAIPTLNKKGRPGHRMEVITDGPNVEHLCGILISETGSFGVRIRQCQRRILQRESVPVDVTVGKDTRKVRVKIGRSVGGDIIRLKPEYDDVKSFADHTGKPYREIEDLTKRKAAEFLGA